MKKTKLLFIGLFAVSALLVSSCGGEKNASDGSTDDSTEQSSSTPETFRINTEQSKIMWEGKMVGPDLAKLLKSHAGYINFNAGTVVLAGDQVKSGSFIIDMTTINATDSNYNEDYTKEKLLGHLASDDFFKTSEYPTASFTLNTVEGNTGSGVLSIRGKSNEEKIENIKVEPMGDHFMISGDLTFDRQKYDVKFDMGMADMIVSDDVNLKIMLATESAK